MYLLKIFKYFFIISSLLLVMVPSGLLIAFYLHFPYYLLFGFLQALVFLDCISNEISVVSSYVLSLFSSFRFYLILCI